MFRLSVSVDGPVHPRIQATLCDAVESLRVAIVCIDNMLARFDEVDERRRQYIDEEDLHAMRINFSLYAGILQHTYGTLPTLPDRVFATIRAYENRWPGNAPGIEKTILAGKLAERRLRESLALSGAINGVEFDTLDDFIFGAADVVSFYTGLLDSAAAVFDPDVVLDAVLDDEPLPSPGSPDVIRRFLETSECGDFLPAA